MSGISFLLPWLIPLSLAAIGLIASRTPGQRPRRLLGLAQALSLAGFGFAVVVALKVFASGPATSPSIGPAPFDLALRLDALSVTLLMLVSFVGIIVLRFSRNYLDGDPRQGAFTGYLAWTLAAVTALVMSGTLFHLVLAWIATSLGLHKLLVFYPERPGAQLAARKKFLSARAGDVCLILAALILGNAFDTGDIAQIAAQAESMRAAGSVPAGVPAAAILLAVAALLKSAQFPTHGWLLEVMETPTPVSALLHAGIINAGGFLVVRFADVMLMSGSAMILLALVGALTALIATAVMTTQSAVKASLAWSTVAQMGFMLMQCGFGAFSAAVLHIVAHSLYKAHGFLASGSVVDQTRAAGRGKPDPTSLPWVATSMVLAVLIFLGVGALLGLSFEDKPAIAALGAILVMGASRILAANHPRGAVLVRLVPSLAAVSALYVLLQQGFAAYLAGTLPPSPAPAPVIAGIMGFVVIAFALVILAQHLPGRRSPQARALYVWAANGFYANALFNRLAAALDRPTSSKA